MRLAFFCGSLEPGRDGVGDYTRRLAGECIRQGHPCAIIAINDSHVSEVQNGSQEIECTAIPTLRLPALLPWSGRMVKARHWVDAFKPEWASFQFVPFAFHRKGMCFGLGKLLANVNTKASWHIMFHELWLGLGEKSPVKDRVYGALQKHAILDLVDRLRPRILHTQAEPYRRVLNREKMTASILPLFSNIPQVEGDGWDGLLEPLVTKAAGKRLDRTNLYLAGILGGVHPEWNAEQAVNTLLPLVQKGGKNLVLVFHGKNNLAPEAFDKLTVTLQNRAHVVVTGERTEAEISRILQSLDLGLATSPRQVIQKSGSVAAMLEHGLQILVTRDDWRLREPVCPPEDASPNLLSPAQFALLKILPARSLHPLEGNSLKHVAALMLEPMNSLFSVNEKGRP